MASLLVLVSKLILFAKDDESKRKFPTLDIVFSEGPTFQYARRIHFEEYQDPGLSEKVQAVIREMNDHIAALGQAQRNPAEILKTSVIKLEESRSLADAFPSQGLVRVLAAHDVVFHVAFFQGFCPLGMVRQAASGIFPRP